jgi:cyclic pyranopterin phosphate synthase
MPEEGVSWIPHENILTYEDLLVLIDILQDLGIRKIRITGGEPLVRKDIASFLKRLKPAFPNLRFALTTNGILLEKYTEILVDAGFSGVNVSLDTLVPENFAFITRGGDLRQVLRGIARAASMGISIKINTVLIRGFNDGEIVSLLEYAQEVGALLRFIEFMPLDGDVWSEGRFLPADLILQRLPEPEMWHFVEKKDHSEGPALYLRHEKTTQCIGVIAAVTHHFCDACNRLRFTADGEVRSCLFSRKGTSLFLPLRARERNVVKELIMKTAQEKPRCWKDLRDGARHMSRIGG